MRKSANVNEKGPKQEPINIDSLKTDTLKKETKRKTTKKVKITEETEPDVTVRHLSEGDKSILEDLGIIEKLKLEHDKNVQYNKKYGFDVPFINEMMQNFNTYLNTEGKQFINTAEESLKNSEEDDDSINIHLKLIFTNPKERILFKELLLTTEKYPILVTIGDYDFFFEYFDEDQDPIFSYNKTSFEFFFQSDIGKLKAYLQKNPLQFGFKYNNNVSFDELDIKMLQKEKEQPKQEDDTKYEIDILGRKIVKTEEQPKQEEPKLVELPKNEIKDSGEDFVSLKKAYKVKLSNIESSIMVITDNPSEIFTRFTANMVIGVKLIGNGVCI